MKMLFYFLITIFISLTNEYNPFSKLSPCNRPCFGTMKVCTGIWRRCEESRRKRAQNSTIYPPYRRFDKYPINKNKKN